MEGAALPTVPMDCFDLFDVFRNLSVYNETRFLAIYRLYFANVGYVALIAKPHVDHALTIRYVSDIST